MQASIPVKNVIRFTAYLTGWNKPTMQYNRHLELLGMNIASFEKDQSSLKLLLQKRFSFTTKYCCHNLRIEVQLDCHCLTTSNGCSNANWYIKSRHRCMAESTRMSCAWSAYIEYIKENISLRTWCNKITRMCTC